MDNEIGMNTPPEVLAKKVDEYYDAQLYEGMPMELARWVEDCREEAHRKLAAKAIEEGFAKVGQA